MDILNIYFLGIIPTFTIIVMYNHSNLHKHMLQGKCPPCMVYLLTLFSLLGLVMFLLITVVVLLITMLENINIGEYKFFKMLNKFVLGESE